MNFLFVHTNFPAQFRYIAVHLAQNPVHRVFAIGSLTARELPGVTLQTYGLDLRHANPPHPFARSFDIECRRAEQVLYVATSMASAGFRPDVIVVHSGWGENMPLRQVFPNARIVTYCEFYYRPIGQDVNFDPEFGDLSIDGGTALNIRNANGLLALIDADDGLSPTVWQRSTYPKVLQDKIRVIHEGIDTEFIRPDASATVRLPTGRTLAKGDPVITFVSRNLEPLRGYHVFMRALPAVLAACPDAQVVIVGGDNASYGPTPKQGSWRDIFLEEVRSRLDMRRVHFIDKLAYETYLKLLQVSGVHVYLTYPFVLSWSLMEAMSTGCTIVASDTAPIQDVLDHNSAILTPFLDVRALAAAMIDCIAAPERFADLGVAARRVITADYDLARHTIPRLESFLTQPH